jgi:CYTH domain-containing protein
MNKIYRCLQSFAYQTVSAERFEILLLVNFSDQDQLQRNLDIAKLYEEIDRAKKDFPHLDIRVAALEFEHASPMTIGYLRSILCDAVVNRVSSRGPTGDLIILSFDADTRAIRQQLLESHIRTYSTRPEVLSIQGGIIWSPEGLQESKGLFIKLAQHSAANMVSMHRNRWPKWCGPTSSIRLSAYCLVGGYEPDNVMHEEVKLLKKLVRLDGSSGFEARVLGGPSTVVVTSNRRATAAHRNDIHVDEQWKDARTEFTCSDHTIRASEEGNASPSMNSAETKPDKPSDEVALSSYSFGSGRRFSPDVLRCNELLSRQGLLADLFQTYTIDDKLVQRMLRPLSPQIIDNRGEVPNTLPALAAADKIHERHARFLSGSGNWRLALASSIQRQLAVLNSQIKQVPIAQPTKADFVVQGPDQGSLREELIIYVPLRDGQEVLKIVIDQEGIVELRVSVSVVQRQNLAAVSEGLYSKLIAAHEISSFIGFFLPESDLLFFEPTRSVAERIANMLVSLERKFFIRRLRREWYPGKSFT